MVAADERIEISTDEVLFLTAVCDLAADAESPLGSFRAQPDEATATRTVQSLSGRQLVDPKTLRPHRELIRRLLIVSHPDCRVVLLRAGRDQSERMIDAYERSGAFVPYSRQTESHSFGPPLELVDLLDEIMAHFSPRRSTGDFIDFALSPAEHFAFSLAGTELASSKLGGIGGARIGSGHPNASLNDATLDGAILLPGKQKRLRSSGSRASAVLPIPTKEEWEAALDSLSQKNLINRSDDGYELRPYLHDLALGMNDHKRLLLTRFDFHENEMFVRDVTFVPVPGSIFSIRTTLEGGLVVKELDGHGVDAEVRAVIEGDE